MRTLCCAPQYPRTRGAKQDHINPADRLDRAGHALIEAIRAARRLRQAVSEFRTAIARCDQAAVVEAAAREMSGTRGLDEAQWRDRVWQQAHELFHWTDLSRLEPWGSA